MGTIAVTSDHEVSGPPTVKRIALRRAPPGSVLALSMSGWDSGRPAKAQREGDIGWWFDAGMAHMRAQRRCAVPAPRPRGRGPRWSRRPSALLSRPPVSSGAGPRCVTPGVDRRSSPSGPGQSEGQRGRSPPTPPDVTSPPLRTSSSAPVLTPSPARGWMCDGVLTHLRRSPSRCTVLIPGRGNRTAES